MTRASLVAAVLLALGLALVPFGAVADTSAATLKKAAAENARYQKVLNSLAQADEDATFFYQSAVERCAPDVSGNDCRKQAAADLQAKHDDIGKRRAAAIKDHEARMQAIIAGDRPTAPSAGGAGGSWTDPEGNVVSGVPVYWTAPNGQKFKWAPTYRFGMLEGEGQGTTTYYTATLKPNSFEPVPNEPGQYQATYTGAPVGNVYLRGTPGN